MIWSYCHVCLSVEARSHLRVIGPTSRTGASDVPLHEPRTRILARNRKHVLVALQYIESKKSLYAHFLHPTHSLSALDCLSLANPLL